MEVTVTIIIIIFRKVYNHKNFNPFHVNFRVCCIHLFVLAVQVQKKLGTPDVHYTYVTQRKVLNTRRFELLWVKSHLHF